MRVVAFLLKLALPQPLLCRTFIVFREATKTGVASEGGANILMGHGIAQMEGDLIGALCVITWGTVSPGLYNKAGTIWTLQEKEEKSGDFFFLRKGIN